MFQSVTHSYIFCCKMNVTIATNVTDVKYYREQHYDWILAVFITSLLMVFTLWIIFSLSHYGIKTRTWSRSQLRNADKLSGGIIYTSTLCCAIMSLIRYISSLVGYNVGFGTSARDMDACERISDAQFAIYCLVLFSVYIFLWLRQRVFYDNEMLNTNFSTTLKFFSVVSIVLIFVAGIGVILISALPQTYPSSLKGCTYQASDKGLDDASWIAGGAVLVLGQTILVALFIYPLQKNVELSCRPTSFFSRCLKRRHDEDTSVQFQESNRDRRNPNIRQNSYGDSIQVIPIATNFNQSNNQARPTFRRNLSKRSTARVIRIMRRTIIFGALSIFSDIALLLVSTFTVDGTAEHRRMSLTIYDVNVFLNLMLVICSFLSYKDMLMSPWKRSVSENNSQVSGSNSN
ncbi:unnamed protein product [Clavelina lepadiformis]|uniref:Uncharacterized protein n=1 Tax=Clavelina lepadiformis TaxID=159417 RepID=A0ABP0GW58_CLALP